MTDCTAAKVANVRDFTDSSHQSAKQSQNYSLQLDYFSAMGVSVLAILWEFSERRHITDQVATKNINTYI